MRTFAQLFQGRSDCFGLYHVFEQRKDGKQKGKGTTYPNDKSPDRVLEDRDWDRHLSGDQMLGIVPVLPDGTCSWFAIDIDDYSLIHKKIVVEIEQHELPLVTCRSKSGGAHLYCFVNGFIDAALAIQLGKKWAGVLGFPRSEVFPKQAKFDNPKAIGNWIILPYYGSDKAVDFGLDIEGNRLSLSEFIQWANAKTIQINEAPVYLEKQELNPDTLTQDDIFHHTPPCIKSFITEGLPEGGRNNSMAHICVYYQKIDEFLDSTDWKERVNEFNQKHMDPPLTFNELAQIIRNHTPPGKYQYYCKQQPMLKLCDKPTCLKLKFGVGEDRSYYGDVEIQSMIKIDAKPPLWIPRINGVDVEMDTETLLNPRKFRMAVADALSILMPSFKQPVHDGVIGPIMKDALTIEPMDELTVEGKVINSFTEWTKNMVTKSRAMTDLEKGLPFYDKKLNRIVFKGSDFIKEYRRIYKDNITDRAIWAALRKNGFQRKQIKLGSKPDWVWYFPITPDEELWFEMDSGEQF